MKSVGCPEQVLVEQYGCAHVWRWHSCPPYVDGVNRRMTRTAVGRGLVSG